MIEEKLNELVVECHGNGIFKVSTTAGHLCLLEATYQQATCRYFGREAHYQGRDYRLCCHYRNYWADPQEKKKVNLAFPKADPILSH